VLEAALVAWLIAALGDRTLKGLKVLVFGSPERAALTTAMGVAATALLERVPAEARADFDDALSKCLVKPPAIVCDGVVPVKTAIIDGLLAQVGPLADAGISASGRSYLSEIGVDGDQVLADLPGIVIRSIQQVGASNPALQPLAAQLNADVIQADTRQILDAVQVLLTQARVAPALPEPGSRPRHLDVELLDPLIDAMQLMPSFGDYNARNSIINALRPSIRGAIARSPIARIEILNTIQTAANYTGGLAELRSVLRTIEGDSDAMRHLDETIGALTQNDLLRRQLESGPGS
jgi:hypothetical protein